MSARNATRHHHSRPLNRSRPRRPWCPTGQQERARPSVERRRRRQLVYRRRGQRRPSPPPLPLVRTGPWPASRRCPR
jgi:hypothetical protein